MANSSASMELLLIISYAQSPDTILIEIKLVLRLPRGSKGMDARTILGSSPPTRMAISVVLSRRNPRVLFDQLRPNVAPGRSRVRRSQAAIDMGQSIRAPKPARINSNALQRGSHL
jgi:hypothetical protein